MADSTGGTAFVGFYWTLPVPRFGFTKLPASAEEAAKESRTIRYQREMIRQHVAEKQGRIVGEIAWMEENPDRGGHFAQEHVEKAFALCRASDAMLLYVDFGESFGWRKHNELHRLLAEAPASITCRPLSPDCISIDGELFNPVAHFRKWRSDLEKARFSADRKEDYAHRIATLISPFLPPERSVPDYRAAAAFLQERGFMTTTAKPWQADSLRMFLNKYRTDAAVQGVSVKAPV